MHLHNSYEPVAEELRKRAWEDSIWPHRGPVPSLTEGLPCWIGESHASTYHNIKSLGHPVALLHFDAHVDMDDTSNGLDHGNWITQLFDEGLLLDVFSVGLRTEHHRPFPHTNGTELPNMYSIQQLNGPLFVTIDLDVFDPPLVPATGMKVPDGLSFRQFREILWMAQGKVFCGADIMEYHPSLDAGSVTASLIAGAVFELAYLFETGV